MIEAGVDGRAGNVTVSFSLMPKVGIESQGKSNDHETQQALITAASQDGYIKQLRIAAEECALAKHNSLSTGFLFTTLQLYNHG